MKKVHSHHGTGDAFSSEKALGIPEKIGYNDQIRGQV
jgi:hypothetical protein